MTEEKFYHFLQMPFQIHAPGVLKRMIWGKEVMFANYQVKKEFVAIEHSHINEQITFVSEGELRVTVRDKPYTLKKGDAIVIPSNVPHSIEVLEDGIVFEIFSPPRQDWIDA